MIVQFPILVANATSLVSLGFSRIEVWSSQDHGGTYTEVTSSSATPATLNSSPASTLFRMGGRSISVSVNGGISQSVIFSDVLDYWNATQVAGRINEVIAGLASVTNTNIVTLTSPTTGRASTLQITYNDSDDLGLPTGMSAVGNAIRPTLNSNILVYGFSDVAGNSGDYYKWRFSANGSSPISEYSDRIIASQTPTSPVPTSIGISQFLSLDGKPQKRSIIIVSDMVPTGLNGYTIGNELPLVVGSDDFGLLQVTLVCGVKVRAAIEGTAFVREFTVPSTPSFDILQVMASVPDPYSVQTTPPFLVRRSI